MIGLGTLEELKYERQSELTAVLLPRCTDVPVHKQQRSRQLNDGAFERRIHQGMEGGKSAAEQGELFGTQNIFRFNPNGFVAGNVSHGQRLALTTSKMTDYYSSSGCGQPKTASPRTSLKPSTMTRMRMKRVLERCVINLPIFLAENQPKDVGRGGS